MVIGSRRHNKFFSPIPYQNILSNYYYEDRTKFISYQYLLGYELFTTDKVIEHL